MVFTFLQKRKYTAAFFGGVCLELISAYFAPINPGELNKIADGFVGAIAQGVMSGAHVVLALWLTYFVLLQRDIGKLGILFCFFCGMLVVSPITEFLEGYPFGWAILYSPAALAVLTVGYHLLYRFHFRIRK